MANKKLNRRQQWRVEKIQKERQKRANKAQQKADDIVSGDLLPEEEAWLVSHYGQQIEVELASNRQRLRCYVRSNLPSLVCGDKLVVQQPKQVTETQQEGVVVARLDRTSELLRPDTHGRANAELKPVAANIDQINIVIAPEPAAPVSIIDRYLVACHLSEIEPIIIFNKADLESADTLYQRYQDIYKQSGIQWISVSIHHPDTLTALNERLKDRFSVFVGQSGVGKSSLINKLIPDLEEQQKTNIISSQSKLGQHTTTTARLFHFPAGGVLIDSPGIREFGLWHIDPFLIPSCYRELEDYLGKCRFRDCQHQHEPGCAIKQAFDDGAIHEERYASMEKLIEEAKDS